jgi:hypothetical protein
VTNSEGVMHFEGNPMTGPVTIEKVMSFYDEMKIYDKCTFSEG